jgi:hypothetical protein
MPERVLESTSWSVLQYDEARKNNYLTDALITIFLIWQTMGAVFIQKTRIFVLPIVFFKCFYSTEAALLLKGQPFQILGFKIKEISILWRSHLWFINFQHRIS